MKKIKMMKDKCRVPGSRCWKQDKCVGFMCKWRGFVWLREERGRGLGLDLGFTKSPMRGMKMVRNKCIGWEIPGAAKT